MISFLFNLWLSSPLHNRRHPFIQWLVQNAVTRTDVQNHFVVPGNSPALGGSKKFLAGTSILIGKIVNRQHISLQKYPVLDEIIDCIRSANRHQNIVDFTVRQHVGDEDGDASAFRGAHHGDVSLRNAGFQ